MGRCNARFEVHAASELVECNKHFAKADDVFIRRPSVAAPHCPTSTSFAEEGRPRTAALTGLAIQSLCLHQLNRQPLPQTDSLTCRALEQSGVALCRQARLRF